ncbi:probable Dolichyl pyrophosphate Glc1Man9GlcNAc2 alpha-1,3-glucosyltransferase [Saccharomycodes ludwigii]|uniref:Alpha-1,3-glucosyltransferase n=1 Tax=Saccharomycodes ludwigii TaxID=36035 RepID=A0A376BBT4_9ASCO|nr:hypothetical protein SCDLUD_003143 [Saccharomycodes ludwigii]KAH3900173.1 hypothetical protein SCDLUD_003143 [Saccharomycodes ludwigii]SSD61590.1 probable Dolichyl pyrophosphate Glc1Man9GlcNAc2 alpha-1,3-glucosyltransferase [Saccharomycodes ludwigii]
MTTAGKKENLKQLQERGKATIPTNNVESRNYSLWNFWVALTVLKILLFPGYYSTDFDVHRNWMAITNKLPLTEWYFEATNQWTLDYPPFFAYFEYILSKFVPKYVIDDGCLDIVEVGHFSFPTIFFQRSTVIISEILLFVVLQIFINKSKINERAANFIVASSIVLSPGFLIIDHIHFQYNGFLFSILIASIISAKFEHYLTCAFFFTVALCFKHIYLYLAPSFFVFLLRVYVLNIHKNFEFKSYKSLFGLIRWYNLVKLSFVVLSVLLVCFAPFIGSYKQLLVRLFPFSRGLTHSYWAPNFWAVYSFLDKVLAMILKTSPKKDIGVPNINTGTRGLVQDVEFLVLPQIEPKITFILTLFYQMIATFPVLFCPNFKRFLGSLTLCGYASFLFGWHVHEKAILLVIIPFSFLVISDRRLLTPFRLVTSASYVSLFPLLFTSQDFLLKILYVSVWCLIFFFSLRDVTKISSSVERRVWFFDRIALVYIIGLLFMVLACGFLDAFVANHQENYKFLAKYEFLSLMIYSVYCSMGIIGSWLGLSWLYNFDEPLWE